MVTDRGDGPYRQLAERLRPMTPRPLRWWEIALALAILIGFVYYIGTYHAIDVLDLRE